MAVVVLLATLTGCDGGSARPVATASSSEAEAEDLPTDFPTDTVDRSRRFTAAVTARGTGVAAFEWSGSQEILLTRVGRPGLNVNLLSVGVEAPQVLPDDPVHRFRWAFDLLGEYQDAPATFTIAPGAAVGEKAQSQAFLIWLRVVESSKHKPAVFDQKEVEYLKGFTRVQAPCTLQIGEGERTGSLSCPELVTADGEVAGLTVSWEQTGEDRPAE